MPVNERYQEINYVLEKRDFYRVSRQEYEKGTSVWGDGKRCFMDEVEKTS